MNANNSSQAFNSSRAPWCPTSVIDDKYIAIDYFFIVLSTTLNVLTCPLIILLNTLIIIAVKIKPRLQTQYNMLLACMAVTDLAVGMMQPAYIAKDIFMAYRKKSPVYCTFYQVIQYVTVRGLCMVTLFHLVVIGMERYVAMKFALRYEDFVTKKRLIIAVTFCWLIGTVYSVGKMPGIRFAPDWLFPFLSLFSVFFIVYSHISVYLITRRHLIQINSEQVSMEAKQKFQEERKATKTTTIILLGVFLSYLPSFISGVISQGFRGSLAGRIAISSFPLTASCYLFNSLFNPVIYCLRNTALRDSVKQLLKRQ